MTTVLLLRRLLGRAIGSPGVDHRSSPDTGTTSALHDYDACRSSSDRLHVTRTTSSMTTTTPSASLETCSAATTTARVVMRRESSRGTGGFSGVELQLAPVAIACFVALLLVPSLSEATRHVPESTTLLLSPPSVAAAVPADSPGPVGSLPL